MPNLSGSLSMKAPAWIECRLPQSWQFRLELRRLYAEQRRLRREHQDHFEESKKDFTNKEVIEALRWEYSQSSGWVSDKIQAVRSRYLIEVADRLMLPLPPYQEEGGAWERTPHSWETVLTDTALADLRNAIRHERSEKLKGMLGWITPLAGLLGTVTGLIAVIGQFFV